MKKTNSISIGGIRIVIGNAAVDELAAELKAKRCSHPMVVTDKGIGACGLLKYVEEPLKQADITYLLFDEVPSDPPSAVVAKGVELFKEQGCDSVIAVGGGSVMDCAKAINIMSCNEGNILEYDNSPSGGRKFEHDGHPLFSIPTTSGTGSEVTQYAVITSEAEQRKATIGDERLTSKVVFLSPLMTAGLPQSVTAATGMDALAHAVEAYTSNRVLNAAGSPVFSDTLAIQAVQCISQNLGKAYANGADLEARKNMMLGSTMAGLITQAGSGAAHGMGTPLGAHFHVPHGVSVGMMLPYVMEYNLPACPERYRDIALAMGRKVEDKPLLSAAREAVLGVRELLEITEFPKLKDFVREQKDIDMLAADAEKDKCCQLNARIVKKDVAKSLYLKAWNAE